MLRSQADIDAANQYASYQRGWKAGASTKAMDPVFTQHADEKIRTAYSDGYTDGRHACQYAMQGAAQRYGHTPSILRLADESNLAEPC